VAFEDKVSSVINLDMNQSVLALCEKYK